LWSGAMLTDLAFVLVIDSISLFVESLRW
jgi:hypothetical protein